MGGETTKWNISASYAGYWAYQFECRGTHLDFMSRKPAIILAISSTELLFSEET
jgi:hypothetical protein